MALRAKGRSRLSCVSSYSELAFLRCLPFARPGEPLQLMLSLGSYYRKLITRMKNALIYRS